jgi:flagellar basal-body rod protein FlgB
MRKLLKGVRAAMSGSIGSIVTDIGTKSLDALWMRANAISDNIANNDTVGYKAKTVEFEDQLANALSGDTITESQLAGINPVQTEVDGTYGTSGNGVDLESQFVELTRNQLQYSYLERGVSDSLGLLLTAASEGK